MLLRLTERVHDGRGRPAFLNAFLNAGASNCCQRTDVVVSGRRTHTCVADRARNGTARGDRDGDCGRGNSDEERR